MKIIYCLLLTFESCENYSFVFSNHVKTLFNIFYYLYFIFFIFEIHHLYFLFMIFIQQRNHMKSFIFFIYFSNSFLIQNNEHTKKCDNCESCEIKLENTKCWKNKFKWKCQNSNFEINFIFLSRDLNDFDVSICI